MSKQATPEVKLSVSEQDALVRRAKKRRQKATVKKTAAHTESAPGTNYMKNRNRTEWERKEGRQQAIRLRGLDMLAILENSMTSTSAVSAKELRDIGAAYIVAYIEVRDIGWPERHNMAKAAALKDCSPCLLRFAGRQLDSAERQTRPAKNARVANDQRELATAS